MSLVVWMNVGVAFITVFRFLMYVFALEMNTRTKFSSESWKSDLLQEMAYQWTRTLRMLFGFRLLATCVVVYGADPMTNQLFLLITVIFNLFFLLDLLGFTGWKGIGKSDVVQPHNINVPKVLTWIDFLAPLFCLVYLLSFV